MMATSRKEAITVGSSILGLCLSRVCWLIRIVWKHYVEEEQ